MSPLLVGRYEQLQVDLLDASFSAIPSGPHTTGNGVIISMQNSSFAAVEQKL